MDTVRGTALDRLQRTADSETFLNAARALAEASQPHLLGEVELALGNLDVHQGRFPQAKAHFRRSLEIARQRNQSFLQVNAFGSLGYVATWEQHFDEAIDFYRSSLALSQSMHANASSAKTLGNLAWSYRELGDLENSLAQFREAERASQQAGLDVDRAYWLNSAADVEFQLRDLSAAESDAQQALKLMLPLKDNAAILECFQVLAFIEIHKEHYEQAQHFLEEAAKLSVPNPAQLLYTRLIAAHLSLRTRRLADSERAFSEVASDEKSPPSLRWEARAGLAQVHATQGKTAIAEREFAESVAAISDARKAIQQEDYRLSFLTNAIQFYDSYVAFLIGRQRPLQALRVADLSRSQILDQALRTVKDSRSFEPKRFDPQSTAGRLNATLLFYWLGEERSWLWVITRVKTSLVSLPANGEIDPVVTSYRDSFVDPRDPVESDNSDGKKLYAMLVQPVEKLIPKNSRVIVLPDGTLNSLNFETLISSELRPHYWIEDVTLSAANSLSLLGRSSSFSGPQVAKLLLVGDAVSATPDFPPLPLVGKEVSLIEKYFPASNRVELTGKNATPAAVLASQPEHYSHLHFATHGTASRLRPLESAIILSPQGESFKLYARDIIQHPLSASLVIISACNGSGVKTYAGEGLVGLSWAFLRAGAHNVIAGLWEVSNASTPQLMDELYKNLSSGQDPATALRNAKLSLVHSSGNYRRPFYWAPFLLYSGS